jgi:hypothetical protein
VLSATIVSTEQRSDTHVYGGGTVTGGTGTTTVGSTVTVVRDLWVKEQTGEEHHLRFHLDIPVRVGQLVHYITLAGPNLRGGVASTDYSLYIRSVNEFWPLHGAKFLAKNFIVTLIGWSALASLVVPVFLIAIPVYFIARYRTSRKRKAIEAEIADAHQSSIDEFYHAGFETEATAMPQAKAG